MDPRGLGWLSLGIRDIEEWDMGMGTEKFLEMYYVFI